MESYKNQSTTIRDYLKIIFNHKILFIILPIAIIIPVFISLQLKTPIYSSKVTMYIKAAKQAEADYYSAIGSRNLAEEHIQFVKSNIVVERVITALKLYNLPIDYEMRFTTRLKAALMERRIAQLKQRISEMSAEQKQAFLYRSAVERLRGSISALLGGAYNFFTISVADYDPALATVIANSVSRSYVIFDLEQQIIELQLKYGEKHKTVVQLQSHINTLQPALDGRKLSDIEAIGPASIKIVGQATRGNLVAGVNKNMILSLSFIAGIILAIVFCFVLEIFDQSIRFPKDIEALHIPFLGAIPKRRSRESLLIGDDNPKKTAYARSFRNLSEKLLLLMRDKNLKTVLVTDIEQSKDTTAVIANLGIFLSQKTGHNVLIIDADLRHSLVSKTFQVPSTPGLSDVLEGKCSVVDVIQNLGPNLFILPAGKTSSDPSLILRSAMMSELFKHTKSQYDIVFIISADARTFSDAVILSSITDGTAFVINEGKVRRQVIENVIKPLRLKKVNIIGAILNNRKYVIPEIIYRLT